MNDNDNKRTRDYAAVRAGDTAASLRSLAGIAERAMETWDLSEEQCASMQKVRDGALARSAMWARIADRKEADR